MQLSNTTISGETKPIALENSQNVFIFQPRIVGYPTQRAINLYKCQNITVFMDYFENVQAGILAQECTGGIQVIWCKFKNMIGPMPLGQAVQFNETTGAGCHVSYNNIQNYPWATHAEDGINMYKSNGMPGSPILIYGNNIRGGSDSKTGSGILVGDRGGSYITVQANTLVNTGAVGIGVAGGDNIRILNNKIFGNLTDSNVNVGLYVAPEAGDITNCVVKYNRINWLGKNGYPNNWWLWDQSKKPDGWDNGGNVLSDATLNAGILPGKVV